MNAQTRPSIGAQTRICPLLNKSCIGKNCEWWNSLHSKCAIAHIGERVDHVNYIYDFLTTGRG
jgi:hypothetical protein